MSLQSPRAAVNPDELAPLLEYLQSMLGIRLDGNRGLHLLAAVAQAVQRSGAPSTTAYLERVRQDPTTREDLLALATVGETYFFRHPEQLEILARRLIPELLEHRGPGHRLKMWSAGCASGEEAYTLAMLADEVGLSTATVLGTDVSREALRHAAKATYGPRSVRGRSPQAHGLEAAGGRFRIPPQIAKRVEFRTLSLLHDAYPQDVDVILCRNVLMYLDRANVRTVGERLANSLAPGGWLVTAPADPDIECPGVLESVMTRVGLMYRRLPAPTPEPIGRSGARTIRASARRIPPTHRDEVAEHTADQAVSALRSGDHAAAAAAARAVVAAGDDSAAIRVVWARALGNAGRISEGQEVAAAAIAAFPLDAELRALHAELLLEADRPMAAAEEASAAIYLDPALGEAYLVLGRAELNRGRAQAARRAFQRAGELLQGQQRGSSRGGIGGYAAAYEQLAGRGADGS